MHELLEALKGVVIGFMIGASGSRVDQMLSHAPLHALLLVNVLIFVLEGFLLQTFHVHVIVFAVMPLFFMTQPRLWKHYFLPNALQLSPRSQKRLRDILAREPEEEQKEQKKD